MLRSPLRWGLATALIAALPHGSPAVPLPTGHADFLQPGTQPSPTLDNFGRAIVICQGCHADYLASDDEPYDGWAASMMAQAGRDPVTRAAALLAEADAAGSGETCIRCHAPIGWLAGRSAGGRFADLTADDRDGVACNVCHRMLDPIARPDAPAGDGTILAALDAADVRPSGTCRGAPATSCTNDAACTGTGPCDVDAGSGRFVVDPADTRRGPFEVGFFPGCTR